MSDETIIHTDTDYLVYRPAITDAQRAEVETHLRQMDLHPFTYKSDFDPRDIPGLTLWLSAVMRHGDAMLDNVLEDDRE